MRTMKSTALATIAIAGLLVSAACGSSADKADNGSDAKPTYGECETYGEQGSIELSPVKDGQLTVQTNLPSPGWWKGEAVDEITGGYEYCLAANVAFRAGLPKLQIDNVSFDALVAGDTKGYDMAMAQISVTPEREKVVTFSTPYFDSDLGVLAPADSDVTADNIKDKKIGVQVGTTSVDWVNNTLKPNTEAQLFEDTTSMVTAVTSGLVDLAIQDTAIMLGFAKNSGGKLAVIGQFSSGEQYAALLPQGGASNDAINKAIDDMKADGTLDKLSATWLGPELGGDPASVPLWTVK